MLSKFCSSDWQPKTSHPCRDGHSHAIQSASNNSKNQAMCLAALLPHANADPTPLHNINTHSAIHAPIPLDWFWFSTSTDVSSCHKDAISRCSQMARPGPVGLLLAATAFMTAFHIALSFHSTLICLSGLCFYFPLALWRGFWQLFVKYKSGFTLR